MEKVRGPLGTARGWEIKLYTQLLKEIKVRGGMGCGHEAQEGGDICMIMADLHCCMAETNTIL